MPNEEKRKTCNGPWKTCFKLSTLLGGFILCLPDGGMWSWGNTSVYVLSYMRMGGIYGSALESPWLLSLFILFETVGLLLASAVSRILGRRLTIVLGIVLLDGGCFSSYCTVQYSMAGLNITSGVMTGFGFGLIYSMVLLYVIDWADNSNEGLFIAVISTAMTVGGSSSIELISHFANPDNETPDLYLGRTKFFTQIDVLVRVPKIYLVLGTGSLILHIVGLALLRDKPAQDNEAQSKETSYDENNCLKNHYPVEKYVDENVFPCDMNERDSTKLVKIVEDFVDQKWTSMETHIDINDSSKNVGGKQFIEIKNGKLNATVPIQNPDNDISRKTESLNIEKCASKTNVTAGEINGKIKEAKTVGHNYSPSEMLRDKSFYILWLALICNDFGYVIFANYYKLFGQLFITNDHSLADVGTAITISVASTRVAWGIMIDKLGVKSVLIIFSAAFSLMFSFYFFTSLLAPWYYYVISVLLACVDSGLHANFSVATLKYFGPEHFASNMGLVMSSTIFLNLAAPPLLRLLLQRWGWVVLFIASAFVNFISLLVVCFGLPPVCA